MQIYIARRLMLVPVTLILVTIIVFLLARLVPGDIIDLIQSELEASSTGESEVDRAAIERALGLDQPIHIQYGRWVGILPSPEKGFSGILQGDFGTSLRKSVPVIDEVLARLPVTFELGLLAIIIGVCISLPIGVFAAIRQDTLADYGGRTVSILMISVPSFWIATLIMIYPSIWWGWSPRIEVIPFLQDPMGNIEIFIIPAVVMGTHMTGGSMRMMRTMMLEVMRQDYIRTAWSKGLRERVIIYRHALKNALIPVITIIGMQLPVLLGGSVIIEQIFCLPGIGRLLIESLHQRDYPMISGINLILSAFVLLCNLAVDLTYGILDPRVRYK
ncbi:ABC transporter permease [Chloroflexota bacterium]